MGAPFDLKTVVEMVEARIPYAWARWLVGITLIAALLAVLFFAAGTIGRELVGGGRFVMRHLPRPHSVVTDGAAPQGGASDAVAPSDTPPPEPQRPTSPPKKVVDPEAQRRSLRIGLSKIAEEGNSLISGCNGEATTTTSGQATEWRRKAYDFVKAKRDESYADRLFDQGDLTLYADPDHAERDLMCNKMRVAVYQLNRMIDRLQ